ncbi:hypothetical protein [Azospirillum endophyticum]
MSHGGERDRPPAWSARQNADCRIRVVDGPSHMTCRYRVCRPLSRLAAARLPRSMPGPSRSGPIRDKRPQPIRKFRLGIDDSGRAPAQTFG